MPRENSSTLMENAVSPRATSRRKAALKNFKKPLEQKGLLKHMDTKKFHRSPGSMEPNDRWQSSRRNDFERIECDECAEVTRNARPFHGLDPRNQDDPTSASKVLSGWTVRRIATSVDPSNCLKNLVAEHATIFSLHAGPGRQFDAAIAGMAGRTGQIGFLHADVMPRLRAAFQSGPDHIFFAQHSYLGKCA